MENCPLCRARLRGASLCPRCGADLQPPQQAERAARRHEQEALRALLADHLDTASRALQQAIALKQHPEQQHLAALIRYSRHHPSPKVVPAQSSAQPSAQSSLQPSAQPSVQSPPPPRPRCWWI